MTQNHLPIFAFGQQIVATVHDNQVTIIAAETGAGKSTQVPLMLLEAGFAERGMIGETEPRRLAVFTVSDYVSELYGCQLGGTIGYQIGGGERMLGEETKVKFMTEGILLNELHSDPLLSRYSVVIVDEAHERGVNQDLLLALLKPVLRQRSDFRLVITSATIDEQRFSDYFGSAPIIKVPGRTFSVKISYADRPLENGSMFDAIVAKVMDILQNEYGDVLVFLPDEASIKKVCRELDKQVRDVRVLPLYGSQPPDEQKQVFVRDGRRRVICATNIAETSLTVDGVRHVVDSGLIKTTVYRSANMSALQIVEHSRAGCDQRAGRAGRTAEGFCHRMFTRENYESREAFTVPEILRTALDQTLLYFKVLGYTLDEVKALEFMDSPEADRWDDAESRLKALGALDATGQVTDDGRLMQKLPLAPMLGRMILSARKFGVLKEVVTIVAGFAGRQVFCFPRGQEEAAREAHAKFRNPLSDALTLLEVWRQWNRVPDFARGAWARENFLSSKVLHSIDDLREQILDILERQGFEMTSSSDPELITKAVAAGLIVNFAVKRGVGFGYRWQGREVFVHPGSAMFSDEPAASVVFVEVVQTTNDKGVTKAYMRGCSQLHEEWLAELIPEQAIEHRFEVSSGYLDTQYKLTETKSWQGMTILSREFGEDEVLPSGASLLIAKQFVAGLDSCVRFHPQFGALQASWCEICRLSKHDPEKLQVVRTGLTEQFGRELMSKTTLNEILRTRLSIRLEDWLEPEVLAAHRERIEDELVYQRQIDVGRQKQAEEETRCRLAREATLAEVTAGLPELRQRVQDMKVVVPYELSAKIRSVEAGLSYSWQEPEETKRLFEGLKQSVALFERANQELFDMAATIRRSVLEHFPVCPLCGGEWDKLDRFSLFCEKDHDKKRLVALEGRNSMGKVGRFLTNRDEKAAELTFDMYGQIHLSFRVSEGQTWTDKKFKTVRYEPVCAILPEELMEEREQILSDLAELQKARLELETLAAQIKEAELQVGTGQVKKLTFRTEGGISVANEGRLRYEAEYVEPYPVAGETWFCRVSKSAGGAGVTARPLFKAGAISSATDLTELAELIRESYPRLPEALTQ